MHFNCDALITLQEAITFAYRKRIAEFAAQNRLPTIFQIREYVEAGGLMSYGLNFCTHYGRGNDAVLSYLSRYVFRTAISNARILGMDQSHVTFRWKDRNANGWRTERLPGVEFLRRFLEHVLPRGFHKVRYYGLWHPSKRSESNRAWVLLILATPADTAQRPRMASLSEALSQLMELTDRTINEVTDHGAAPPRCPHCGSCHTRFLGEYPRFGVP
jgi:hypothetical protein